MNDRFNPMGFIMDELGKQKENNRQLKKELLELIKQVETWAGRPTKDGAKILQEEAAKLYNKYEEE